MTGIRKPFGFNCGGGEGSEDGTDDDVDISQFGKLNDVQEVFFKKAEQIVSKCDPLCVDSLQRKLCILGKRLQMQIFNGRDSKKWSHEF